MDDSTLKLLTAAELAAELRVHANSIRRWTKEGAIPYVGLPGRVYRYNLKEVTEALYHGPQRRQARIEVVGDSLGPPSQETEVGYASRIDQIAKGRRGRPARDAGPVGPFAARSAQICAEILKRLDEER